ncbi:MAG TPA: bifunctional DNA-binding transcriptional regulator/O6-methylguanine-DNA methyltransferase Ada [Gemmatimonadaceae bacterium]|nr:bifunctional DNA-binding transcriptional regulator/O6-methylguanine-DNA methyltransferase Ada [Gemmatimonadaceae bacterium]
MTLQSMQPLSESNAWNSVLNRDESADGAFVYAVATTGVYCRPSCPSRRPKRGNVRFYYSAKAAERAGFRACHRCLPQNGVSSSRAAVARARDYIDRAIIASGEERITLERISHEAGVSPHHLQRKFREVVGLTPAEYARARRSERLKEELRRGETVSRATFGAGYGSSSRLYESANAQLGMTPSTYQRGGTGADIEWVVAKTSLGYLLVAATERGICSVTLGDDSLTLEQRLAAEYPAANRRYVPVDGSVLANSPTSSKLARWVRQVVANVESEQGGSARDIPLDLKATAFQWKVWRELQKIPRGETRSYSEIAAAIGSPRATRAVASACANNPVAVVIPCHRVLRRNGELGGYRWGLDRKRQLLEKESAPRKAGSS